MNERNDGHLERIKAELADSFDEELEPFGDFFQRGLHRDQEGDCRAAIRSMQRKPRWQVEVSIGSGKRAAGR